MVKVTLDCDDFLALVRPKEPESPAVVPPMEPVKSVKVKKERAPRPPSEYNIFMKSEIKRLKETTSEKDNKKLFAMAASNYTAKKKAPSAE